MASFKWSNKEKIVDRICLEAPQPAFFGFGSIDAAVSEFNTLTRYHRQLNIIAG